MKVVPTTLLFIIKDGKILLARKARGFATGKLNGVGGKREKGETIEQTMIRETQEEICVTPKDYRLVGIIEFFEFDKNQEPEEDIMHIFIANDYEGTPTKSDEMDPAWFDVNNVPYFDMFQDDKLWIPNIINGEKIYGVFNFDKDFKLISHNITNISDDELKQKMHNLESNLQ